MKNYKKYLIGVLFSVAALAMTACGSSDNDTNNSNATTKEATTGTTAGNTTNSTNATTSAGMSGSEDSTGVIDGMIKDVESDFDGNTNTTTHANESTR